MLKKNALLVVLTMALGSAVGGRADKAADIDRAQYMEHVQLLASDGLQGRGNGTPGLELAAEYIAERYRTARLSPGGESNSWFQRFDVITGVAIGEGNRLAISNGGRETSFELGRTYYPISIAGGRTSHGSDNATPETIPVVFAGYGISAPDLSYDEYANLDVSGKAVVVFTHEPQENDASSKFDGKSGTRHGTVVQKALVARQRGARMLLIAVDPSHAADEGSYAAWLRDPQAEEYGFTVVRIARDVLAGALEGALNIADVAAGIDRDLRPRSRTLDAVKLLASENFSRVRKPVRNVIGVLTGSHPRLMHEAIVIGAHYDHLGLGGRHSLDSDALGQVHNGADDNASGTAAILEIARVASLRREEFRRSLIFIAFAGEELGLLGSEHYVQHPHVPLERTVAMINLDMIGRPLGRVLVSGLESAPAVREDLKAAGRGRRIEVKTTLDSMSFASSDDTTFVARRVPAILFFSGFHADYHKPSDDWDRIDADGAVEVARIALALAERLARRADRPPFVAPAPSSQTTSSGGGYGPYFGSVPDFVDSVQGVRFADIRPGSPADQAGIRRGDVLVKFDGKPVLTVQDFTLALREKRPGDIVSVVVLRAGQEVTASVRLAVRQ